MVLYGYRFLVMNGIVYASFLLLGLFAEAQTALYNAGNLQLHDNVQIGFHTNWINDAPFEATDGLVGFYGDRIIQVLGNQAPILFDMEVFVPNGLFLFNSINVTNNLNFIEGDLLSALNNQLVYLNFREDAFFTGENDLSKVTGFAAITNKQTFSFPVGDRDQLRPLLLNSDSNNMLAICAYLFEDPSSPSSILESYDTNEKVRNIGEITSNEFWILQTNVPSSVTLSWNARSDLGSLANSVEDIVMVGWSKSSNQWVVIGNTAVSGDLEQGFLISEKFVPNDFSAITFGTIPLPTDTFVVNNPTLGNYFISPNGDGVNDFLVFDNLEDTGPNFVSIYNRFGQKVFELSNYSNEFKGISNINNLVLNKQIGVPEGVYFYIVDLPEQELQYQGFFFLDR